MVQRALSPHLFGTDSPTIQGKFTMRPKGFYEPPKYDPIRGRRAQETLSAALYRNDIPYAEWESGVQAANAIPTNIPTQGQLFTGGHEHPWPRGYTPERQSEVSAALDKTQMWDAQEEIQRAHGRRRAEEAFQTMVAERGGRTAIENREFAALWSTARELQRGTAPTVHSVSKQVRANVVNQVSKSSVPVEDLEGIKKFEVNPERLRDSGSQMTLAHYDQGTIRMIPKVLYGDGKDTVAHEIGHHVSNQAQTPHSAYGRTGKNVVEVAKERGAEEGYADAYANIHAGKEFGTYPVPQQFWGSHGEKSWQDSYNAMNPVKPSPNPGDRLLSDMTPEEIDRSLRGPPQQPSMFLWGSGDTSMVHPATQRKPWKPQAGKFLSRQMRLAPKID